MCKLKIYIHQRMINTVQENVEKKMAVDHIRVIAYGVVSGVTYTEGTDKTQARKTRGGPLYRPKMTLCSELSHAIISITVPHLRLKTGVN